MDTARNDRLPARTGAARAALVLFAVSGLAYSLLAWRALGAGQDPDAWRLALTGLHLWQTGEYAPSRLPGFPVVEFIAALLAPWKTLGFKLATAWVGASCIALTCLLAARHSIRVGVAAALMLAACPAMILASTMMMDYVWSLAFLLLGLLVARQGRAVCAGLLIGLAAGCRVSALAVLPVAVWMLWVNGFREVRRIKWLVLSAMGLAALGYGWVFAKSSTQVGDLGQSLMLVTIELLQSVPYRLFGNIGTAAVAMVVIAALAGMVKPQARRGSLVFSIDGVLILMLAVFSGIYLFMPHEPLYLLPALPPLFVLVARRVPVAIGALLIAVLLLANYRDISSAGTLRGLVAQDIRNRQRSARLTDWLLHHPPTSPALVIAGYRAPMIEYVMKTDGPRLPAGTRVGYLLRAEMVAKDRRSGEALYYLGDALGECRRRGFDPPAYGARAWWPGEPELNLLAASGAADPP